MLKNYLKTALRHLYRHPFYSAINVGGLVIGITTCLLILAYVQHELRYDQHIDDAERVYRIVTTDRSEGNVERTAMTTANLAPVLAQAYPDIEVTRLRYWFFGDILVRHGDQQFNERRFYRADSTFLNVFGLELLQGNPRTALDAPYSILLTETTARKYFGDRNPLGEPLHVNNRVTYTVTGVVRDIPPNAHFTFDFIAFNGRDFPDEWGEKEVWTYVKLPPRLNAEALAQHLPTLVSRYFPEDLHDTIDLAAQPLTGIHLDSHLDAEIEPTGNRTYLYVFSAIALILLLIACINYMNLTTARAAQRAREVGVRKVVGASQKQLAAQLLGESVVFSLIAVLLSVVVAAALRPLLVTISGAALPPVNWLDGATVGTLAAIILCVGFLAGSYPALYLSSFAPIHVLKGALPKGTTAGALRKGLVVFQFAATIVLLIGTFVVHRQLQYMTDDEKGIERDGIVMVTVPRDVAVEWGWSMDTFREELLREPNIVAASAVSIPWDRSHEQHRARIAGRAAAPEVLTTLLWVADDQYADLYGLDLLEGRTPIRQFDPDSTGGIQFEFVLNETAAWRLGLASPVGQDVEFAFGTEGWLRGRVVGLVEDFHFQTLHHEIRPLIFVQGAGVLGVAVRMTPGNMAQTVDRLAAIWERLAPGWPLDYVVLNEDYQRQYQAEQRVVTLVSAFAVLAVTIACLGLFGLASFMAEQRTKEIGVRKVLGASVSSIVLLLSQDVLKLVALALVAGAPIAYVAAQQWLEHFAYRISIGPGLFVLAGGLTLGIALLTVSYQSIKAALADPVQSLRYE